MAAPNPNTGVPWDQTPEYIALTDHVIPPGGQTGYTQLHPPSTSPTDVTSFLYGQRDIRISNWPEVMYMLFPTAEWGAIKKSGPPQQKVDANQQPMFERWPRVGQQARRLLDFPIVPDSVGPSIAQDSQFVNTTQISSKEELWRFDVWRKMDPRMSWDDLTMRIEVHGRTPGNDLKLQNSMQTMLGRFWHIHYRQISWFGKGRFHHDNVNNPARIKLLDDLANATPPIPLNLNTTKGLTPGSINPAHGPNGTVIAWLNIRGGNIRGPRTATVPAAAMPALLVPANAPVTAPVIPPVVATVLPPAIASVVAVTAGDHETRESNGEETRFEDENEGTDAFNESNGDFSEVDDSLDATSAVSVNAKDEDDVNDMTIGDVSDSQGQRSFTDDRDEDAPAYSFNSGQSFNLKRPATPTYVDGNGDAADNPYATGFAPIKHIALVADNREDMAASSSSQPPAKRRCSGLGVHFNTNSRKSKATNNTHTTMRSEHIPPPCQPSLSPVPKLPPSQTPDLVHHSEPYHQSTGLFDTADTESDSSSETTGFFEESGDLPPDGFCY